jgi:hypothetical protein
MYGGAIRLPGLGKNCCPITAVDARHYDAYAFRVSAERLGLSADDIERIVDAADAKRTLYPALRVKLLDAVGLAERHAYS